MWYGEYPRRRFYAEGRGDIAARRGVVRSPALAVDAAHVPPRQCLAEVDRADDGGDDDLHIGASTLRHQVFHRVVLVQGEGWIQRVSG